MTELQQYDANNNLINNAMTRNAASDSGNNSNNNMKLLSMTICFQSLITAKQMAKYQAYNRNDHPSKRHKYNQ